MISLSDTNVLVIKLIIIGILLLPPVILVIMLIRAPLGVEIPGVGFIEIKEKEDLKDAKKSTKH